MQLLEDKNREYQRYRPSPSEKIKLANEGLQWTLSSNVSAVGSDGNDLVIRFHNGSLYSYTGLAHLFDDILRASSKGRWVWQHLRKNGAKFTKIGSLSLGSDIPLTDAEIFEKIDTVGVKIEKLIGNQKERKKNMFAGVVLGKTLPTYKNPALDLAVFSTLKDVFAPLI